MTTEIVDTASGDAKRLPLPDVGDFVFLFVMWLNLFAIPNHLFEDGSTGWHLVSGDYILNTASIPHVDLFSNSFPHKPWVAYEWLYDLFMAVIVELSGMKLLAVILTAAIAFLFLAIYDRTRREGAGIATTFFLSIVAILVSAMHWLARPHLLTFWCVWMFVTMLEDYYRGTVKTHKLFLVLCPLMLLWVNCHPAFMLGLVVTSISVVAAAVRAKFDVIERQRTSFYLQTRNLLLLLIALIAITFINPYGYHLHEYILSYLRGSEIIAATNEFMSPVFKGGFHTTCLEILFVAFGIGLFVCQRRITLPGFFYCMLFGYASLNAMRNMPLFAIVVTPYIGGLLARHYASVVQQAPVVSSGLVSNSSNSIHTSDSVIVNSNAASRFAQTNEFMEAYPANIDAVGIDTANGASQTSAAVTNETVSGEAKLSFGKRIKKSFSDFAEQEAQCKMHLLPIAYTLFLIVVAVCGGSFMGKPFLTSTFDPKLMPVDTAAYVKENRIDMKHLFNYDNWGGYLRYTLGQRVFIDDRADFYGYDFCYQYSTAMAAADGWQEVLADHQINWVLFPRNSTLAKTLESSKGWKTVKSDTSSILFQRIQE
jgi:hypothetical protein